MYDNFKVVKNDKATVTIEGEIPHAEVEKHKTRALKNLGSGIKMDGFREGHIPENILIEKIGEGNLLQEMAQYALAEHYPKILLHHKIDAIGRPNVTVTKLAPGNPLGFKIETAELPKFELPDYKEIAKKKVEESKKQKVEVTDEEINTFIENALRERQQMKSQAEEAGAKADAEAEGKEYKPNEEKKDEPLPELTDELVKTFGEFKDVADFKSKVRDGMQKDKEHKAKEALRIAIITAVAEKTNITVPEVLIEAELDKMNSQFKQDIQKFGLKPEEYLQHIKKTEEDLRKEWRVDAEKGVKQQLVLQEIAIKEQIKPDKEATKKETDHILSHHKDADRHNVEMYVANVLTNQKVVEFLENQGA